MNIQSVFHKLSLPVLLLAAGMLSSCEGMLGDGGKIEFLDNVKEGVKLDDQGKATVRFKSSGAWRADVEYGSQGDGEWLSVNPKSGEQGDEITMELTGVGEAPTEYTPGATLRLSLVDGTDDAKAPVSWPQKPKEKVNVKSFTLNPAGPLTLNVDERKLVEIVYSPANATELNFRVEKPNGTAAFDIHHPYEESRDKFMIYALRPGKAVISITEAAGASGTLEVTVIQ